MLSAGMLRMWYMRASFLNLQVALAIAQGKPFLGPTTKQQYSAI